MAGIVITGNNLGLFGNIAIGIIEALVGGWLASAVFNIQNAISGFNLITFIVAFPGAVIVLYIAKLLKFR